MEEVLSSPGKGVSGSKNNQSLLVHIFTMPCVVMGEKDALSLIKKKFWSMDTTLKPQPFISSTDANGTVVHANGMVVHANGTVVHANGTVVHANGTVVHANGTVVHANCPCKWHGCTCKWHGCPCKWHGCPCKWHGCPCKWHGCPCLGLVVALNTTIL